MKHHDKIPAAAPRPLPAVVTWGYVTGGVLCLTGVIVLSVALGVVLRTATRGVRPLTIPGATALALKEPGVYMAVTQPGKGEAPVPAQELATLDFTLSDTETGGVVPLQKAPGVPVMLSGGKTGAFLFQAEVPSEGKYLLEARYAGDRAGPAVPAFLIHEAVGHNRADIAVGVLLFLVIGGGGLLVIFRTRRMAQVFRAPPPGQKR